MDYSKLIKMIGIFFLSSCCFTVFAGELRGKRYISPQTATIYERYYLIKRIEKAFELLQQPAIVRSFTYCYITPQIYEHPLIATAASMMVEQQSVAPLHEAWRVCKHYQQLYDSRFAIEFVHVLFALCSELGDRSRFVMSKPDNRALHRYIDAIDHITQPHTNETILRSELESRHEPVDTDMIAQRYLVLKRLDKSLQLLAYLQEAGTTIDTNSADTKNIFFDLQVDSFSHSRIKECIRQMYAKKNLDPLLQVANDLQQYRFVADDTFLQEMLMNLFLVYKGLLFNATSEQDGQVIATQMHHVLEIYENIEDVPLDETLDAIDQVTDRLMALQDMEQQHRLKRISKRIIQGLGAVCAGVLIYYYFVW